MQIEEAIEDFWPEKRLSWDDYGMGLIDEWLAYVHIFKFVCSKDVYPFIHALDREKIRDIERLLSVR